MFEIISEQDLQQRRCPKCGKLLGKSYLQSGWIKIKCPRCDVFVFCTPRGATLATPSWIK